MGKEKRERFKGCKDSIYIIYMESLEDNMDEITYSTPNYFGTIQPFFRQDNNRTNISEKTSLVDLNNTLNLLDLSQEIRKFFINHETCTQDIYIKGWTIMSLNSIIERSNNIKLDRISVIDFAFKYESMGYVKIAFYDPYHQKIFYRKDGGSNDFDRTDNYNKLKNYKSELNNNTGLTWDEFIEQVNEVHNETKSLF